MEIKSSVECAIYKRAKVLTQCQRWLQRWVGESGDGFRPPAADKTGGRGWAQPGLAGCGRSLIVARNPLVIWFVVWGDPNADLFILDQRKTWGSRGRAQGGTWDATPFELALTLRHGMMVSMGERTTVTWITVGMRSRAILEIIHF